MSAPRKNPCKAPIQSTQADPSTAADKLRMQARTRPASGWRDKAVFAQGRTRGRRPARHTTCRRWTHASRHRAARRPARVLACIFFSSLDRLAAYGGQVPTGAQREVAGRKDSSSNLLANRAGSCTKWRSARVGLDGVAFCILLGLESRGAFSLEVVEFWKVFMVW